MDFPTKKEVSKASHAELAAWHRFLPPPFLPEHEEVLNQVEKRLTGLGGITPAISKQIGWREDNWL